MIRNAGSPQRGFISLDFLCFRSPAGSKGGTTPKCFATPLPSSSFDHLVSGPVAEYLKYSSVVNKLCVKALYIFVDRLIGIIVSVPEKPEVSTLVPRYRNLMEHVLDISCERKWTFPESEDYPFQRVVPVWALQKMIVQAKIILFCGVSAL